MVQKSDCGFKNVFNINKCEVFILPFTFGLLASVVLCPVRSSQKALLYKEWTETTDRNIINITKLFLTVKNWKTGAEAPNSWKKLLESGKLRQSFHKGSLQSGVHPVSGLFWQRLCLPRWRPFLPPPPTPGSPDPPPWIRKPRDHPWYRRSHLPAASLREDSSDGHALNRKTHFFLFLGSNKVLGRYEEENTESKSGQTIPCFCWFTDLLWCAFFVSQQ